MSTDPDESMDPERALYATLGLTGFGAGNGSTRKRRVDEAFTELNCNSFNPDASGSNTMPLGIRRRSKDDGKPQDSSAVPVASSSGQDVAGPAGAGADATPAPLAATSANQDPATDPTAGMKASDARKYWKKIKKNQPPTGLTLAGFLAYGQSLPVPPPRPTEDPKETSGDSAESTLAASSAALTREPGELINSVLQAEEQTDQAASNESAVSQDDAYFRPSFIEDPWSKCKASRA